MDHNLFYRLGMSENEINAMKNTMNAVESNIHNKQSRYRYTDIDGAPYIMGNTRMLFYSLPKLLTNPFGPYKGELNRALINSLMLQYVKSQTGLSEINYQTMDFDATTDLKGLTDPSPRLTDDSQTVTMNFVLRSRDCPLFNFFRSWVNVSTPNVGNRMLSTAQDIILASQKSQTPLNSNSSRNYKASIVIIELDKYNLPLNIYVMGSVYFDNPQSIQYEQLSLEESVSVKNEYSYGFKGIFYRLPLDSHADNPDVQRMYKNVYSLYEEMNAFLHKDVIDPKNLLWD